MKKIINGKRYDTETATRAGKFISDFARNDFNFYQETLLKKRTGEYFLHGQGEANTRYALPVGGNTWGAGEMIIPMTHKEAEEWAEKHLSTEDFEKEFGEVTEGDTVQVTIYLSAQAHGKLKREVSETGKTQSQIVQELIENM